MKYNKIAEKKEDKHYIVCIGQIEKISAKRCRTLEII